MWENLSFQILPFATKLKNKAAFTQILMNNIRTHPQPQTVSKPEKEPSVKLLLKMEANFICE